MSQASRLENEDRIHALVEAGAALFVARQSGLYRHASSDGSPKSLFQSWQPDQEVATLDLALPGDFAAEGLVLAGINGGVARSEDHGQNWSAQQLRVPAPLVTCVKQSPAFADDRCVLAGTLEDSVFRSGDGGRSWTACSFGLFDHCIFCLALSPGFASDGLAFAGTSSGVYRSDNGGRLWRDLTMPSGDEAVLSLALSPGFFDDGVIVAGTESHGVLRSSDGGETWEVLGRIAGAVNALVMLPKRLIALVDDTVQSADDRGESWNVFVREGVSALAVGEDGTSLLLAMADGSVQRKSLSTL